jgi:hypothetical protein
VNVQRLQGLLHRFLRYDIDTRGVPLDIGASDASSAFDVVLKLSRLAPQHSMRQSIGLTALHFKFDSQCRRPHKRNGSSPRPPYF